LTRPALLFPLSGVAKVRQRAYQFGDLVSVKLFEAVTNVDPGEDSAQAWRLAAEDTLDVDEAPHVPNETATHLMYVAD